MIVVTGATGNIGRPLTQALAEAGQQVTAVSRHPAAVPDGVRHVVADLAEPAGLQPALAGAKALFLLLVRRPARRRSQPRRHHRPKPRPAGSAGSSCSPRWAW